MQTSAIRYTSPENPRKQQDVQQLCRSAVPSAEFFSQKMKLSQTIAPKTSKNP